MKNPVTRRTFAKTLAAGGAVAGAAHLFAAPSSAPISNPNGNPESATTSPAHTPESPTRWHHVFPGVWRATIGQPEPYTPVSSRLVPPQSEAFRLLPAIAEPPLPPPSGKITRRGCLLELPLHPDEAIFGFGLQFLSLNQRGKKKVARVNADPKFDTGDSHAPVPFYVTTNGFGILIDTARYASFYFGDVRPRPEHAADSIAAAGTDPETTRKIQDADPGRILIEVPRAPGVDVYLFAGPSMLAAVQRYNIFSGGGLVPPEWGLGFWYRAESVTTQDGVLALAREFRERNLPCDVIGIEPGWQSHSYSSTFAWDRQRYPDPAEFVRSAAGMQYKVNLWEHAYTHPASPLFPALQPHSGDYGVWGGLVPDFAGAPARNLFGEYHAKTFLDIGVSGFKLDECDNSDFTGGWAFPECSSFPSGIDGEQMHNVFGLRYQMAIWEQFRKRNQQSYNLVRSSGALAAPYPFVLYSDLYNHRDFIRALVNSGFSGLLWCPEVRDATSVEDLLRRLQSVVFSPLAMVNAWYIKNPPWKQLDRKKNNAGQLLDDWQSLEARCREIIGWRMQLVPYLTAAFQKYAQDGTPPFRALVLDTPQDTSLHAVDDQYLIGDRMMVAPLFAGEPGRDVVLPAGSWHDFWTGAAVGGNTKLSVPASTDKIPVYVKSGSIVPWADIGPHTGSPESRRLTARVYSDGSLPFVLHTGTDELRLTWQDGQGSVNSSPAGSKNPYNVYRWQKIG